ncbi:MAG: DUF975 family protein [Ruminococcus sp.]|nr:DUF975 family protein [Ruminococcus sp.]
MRTEKIIRSQTKESLKGNWTAPVAGLFVLLALIYLLEILFEALCTWTGVLSDEKIQSGHEIELIIIICSVFLLTFAISPFKNGYFKLCYNIADGRSDGLRDMFYFVSGIKMYFKTLQFNIVIALKKLLYTLIGFLPYLAFKAVESFIVPKGKNTEIFDIIGIILICLGIVITLYFSIRLFVDEFVYVDNPEANVFDIARTISKNHLNDYYKLVFSFIFWILSCFFVLPGLYVIPYFTTSLGTTSKWLINLYKEGKTV